MQQIKRDVSPLPPPQKIQPKLLSSPHPAASPRTPGHLWSWRMETQRDDDLGGRPGQCRGTGPENRDSFSSSEVCEGPALATQDKSSLRW